MTPQYIQKLYTRKNREIALRRIATALMNPLHIIVIVLSTVLFHIAIIFSDFMEAVFHWAYHECPAIKVFGNNLERDRHEYKQRCRRLIRMAKTKEHLKK